MLEKLNSTLNSFKDSNNKYKISNILDLINDNLKINFYYVLNKYILKNSFYMFQIEFLNFRKDFISSLKENSTKIQYLLKDTTNNNN